MQAFGSTKYQSNDMPRARAEKIPYSFSGIALRKIQRSGYRERALKKSPVQPQYSNFWNNCGSTINYNQVKFTLVLFLNLCFHLMNWRVAGVQTQTSLHENRKILNKSIIKSKIKCLTIRGWSRPEFIGPNSQQ